MMEMCLAWGGEQRLRLQLLLAVAPGMHVSDNRSCCRSACLYSCAANGMPMGSRRCMHSYADRSKGTVS